MSTTAPAGTTPRPAAPGWREEARQDRLIRAQIGRDREAARAQARREDAAARAAARQQARQARAARRQQAHARAVARRAARVAWVRSHVLDLLFVPVIVVPAVLAWTAMAAYGSAIYGPPGLALPAFSEGAMWAFAVATTVTRHRHPDRPIWHLRLGTATFAGYGAALNFAHGMSPAGPGPHGPAAGAVYALVSVAGVLVHQLVTAGPRRSRAERAHARIARAAARREMAARRAALRDAIADLDEHGNARLVYAPGPATLARRRGRAGLASAAAPQARPWPRPAPVLPPAPVKRAPGGPPAPAPAAAPAPARTRDRGAPRTRTPAADPTRAAPGTTRAGAVSDEAAEVHFGTDLAAGRVPSARRIKTELHVGQNRAARIRDHLTAVVTAPREHSRRTA